MMLGAVLSLGDEIPGVFLFLLSYNYVLVLRVIFCQSIFLAIWYNVVNQSESLKNLSCQDCEMHSYIFIFELMDG